MTAIPTGVSRTADHDPVTETVSDAVTESSPDAVTGTDTGTERPDTVTETAPDAGTGADRETETDRDRRIAEGHDDGHDEVIRSKYVIRTTAGCLLFGVFGHVFLWAAYSSGSNAARMDAGLPPLGVWQAAVGVSIVGVALTAFGGFYAASLRARVAIAASFLLTFLVILSYALTIRDFAAVTLGDAAGLVGDFRAIVITVVGFYFGSEAVVSAVKVYSVAKSGSAVDVARADRDLPTGPRRATRTPITSRLTRR